MAAGCDHCDDGGHVDLDLVVRIGSAVEIRERSAGRHRLFPDCAPLHPGPNCRSYTVSRDFGTCVAALHPPPQRRHAAVGAGLIIHAVARQNLGEHPRVGRLLDVEGIEAGAHEKMELVAQHVAGGAQRAAEAVGLAQLPRLAIGAAVAEFGKVERDERQMAEPGA